jgi:hypothetical protein
MQGRVFLAGICLTVGGVTACGGNADSTSASPTTSSTTVTTVTATVTTPPTTTASSLPKVLQKHLGELAGAGQSCGSTIESCDLTFTITKITNCTGGYAGDPPPAGTVRKLVWIQVTTGPNYSTTDIPSGLITRFVAIDSGGVTSGEINPSTFWKCAPETQRMGFGDENWLPGKKYAGAVEIYLPKDSVKVANGEGTWEWTL